MVGLGYEDMNIGGLCEYVYESCWFGVWGTCLKCFKYVLVNAISYGVGCGEEACLAAFTLIHCVLNCYKFVWFLNALTFSERFCTALSFLLFSGGVCV